MIASKDVALVGDMLEWLFVSHPMACGRPTSLHGCGLGDSGNIVHQLERFGAQGFQLLHHDSIFIFHECPIRTRDNQTRTFCYQTRFNEA